MWPTAGRKIRVGANELTYRAQPQMILRVNPKDPEFRETSSVKLQELARSSVPPLRPFGSVGHSVNIFEGRAREGYVTAVVDVGGAEHFAVAMTHLFEDGRLWGVSQHLFRENERLNGVRVMPSGALQRDFEAGLNHFVAFSRNALGVKGALLVSAGVEMIEGLPLVLAHDAVSEPSNRPAVYVNAQIDSTQWDAKLVLGPLYEKLWDACGVQFQR
jgi:hypothetical protein